MKRVVLDTNIIISSALGGALVLILEKCDEGKFTVIVTTDVISEYFAALSRPKFGRKQETIDISFSFGWRKRAGFAWKPAPND